MTGLYCVIHGIQVEIVLPVKASEIFEFQLKHRETIDVCQMGSRMGMEQSCSEVSVGVGGVYWSGFYSDGCGMDRTAQCLGKMLIAYDKDVAELRENSVAAKLVINWVGFFKKMNLLPRELSSRDLVFLLSPSSCKDEKDGLSMCFLACQCFVPGLEPLLFICLWERERWVTVRTECVLVVIPDWQPWNWNLCSTSSAQRGEQQRELLHVVSPLDSQLVPGSSP